MRPQISRRTSSGSASPLYLLHLGLVTGTLGGMAESLFLGHSSGADLSPAAIVNAAVFYAILWGGLGLVVGLIGRAMVAAGRRPALLDTPSLGALVISLLPLVLVASYVNLNYLPDMFSPMSFAVDLLMLAGAAVIWFVIRTVWLRALRGRSVHHRVRAPITLLSVVIVAVLIAIGLAPAPESDQLAVSVGEHTDGVNVLFLVQDALRADHLGCYGYERPTSANLDRMASEGVLFLNAYAQGSRTKETTASMVTSRYASSHGVCDFSSVLPPSSPGMMQLAREAGYRTAVLSANALVSPTFGFGRGVGYFYCEAPSAAGRTLVLETARKLALRLRLLRWLPNALRSLDVLLPMPNQTYPYEGGDPNVMNAAFLSWLDEEPEGDFFAYLHYMDSHAPYTSPPPYDTMYDPDYTGEAMISIPIFPGTMLPFEEGTPLPDDKCRNLVAHYDGAITYFDSAIGKLLEELDHRGLTEKTLVVVVADHGEEFFDHRGWGHGQSVYNELINVPLIMRMPGVLPGGMVARTTIRQIDLLPTMLGAAGVEKTLEASDFDGVNLWDFLVSGRDDWPEPAVMAEVFHGEHQFSRAYKTGTDKLIHAKSTEGEHFMLFDLAADPGETLDVAARNPDLTESLAAQLDNLVSEATSRRLESGTTTIDEGTKERLRALGYIR
ncbi:MAG: sulfatase-like hydrolase/transferase [Candidatus Eisenbacteria bacterium]|nr:sulfatase-like hydrolase/transferase [Candidatus Eisenbacteria bacterium]